MSTYANRYDQAVQDVSASCRHGVCVVRAPGEMWVCTSAAWDAVMRRMQALPADPEMDESDAYRALRAAVMADSPSVVVMDGQQRRACGVLAESRALVAKALVPELLSLEEARRLGYEAGADPDHGF